MDENYTMNISEDIPEADRDRLALTLVQTPEIPAYFKKWNVIRSIFEVALLILVMVCVIVIIILAFRVATIAETTEEDLKTQELAVEISARNDCRAEISTTFTELDRLSKLYTSTLAQIQAQSSLDQFRDPNYEPPEEVVQRFSEVNAKSALANKAVEALPRNVDAWRVGWTPSPEAKAVMPALPDRIEACPVVR